MQSYLGLELINGQRNVKNGQFIYDLSESENASKINELKGSLLYKGIQQIVFFLYKKTFGEVLKKLLLICFL